MKKNKNGFLFSNGSYQIGQCVDFTGHRDDLITLSETVKQIKPEHLNLDWDWIRVLEIEPKSRNVINVFTLKEIMRQYKLSQL
jgi:hypothetical protein